MLAMPDVQLILVEQAFGDRPFVLTDKDNRWHVQVRSGAESEVWVKESLINIGFRHLSGQVDGWKYCAWVDADVQFVHPNWASETVEALQHYRVVQPWSHSIDLTAKHMPMSTAESFCYSYWQDQAHASAIRAGAKSAQPGFSPAPAVTSPQTHSTPYDPYDDPYGEQAGKLFKSNYRYHTGYAWAIRRETYEQLGGLIDWQVMGSADYHMAWALIGNAERAISGKGGSASYIRRCAEFQALCEQHVRRDIGYVPGTLVHFWHGKKRNRFYVERSKALSDAGFDPDTDVRKNAQGLLVLTGKNLALRDALRVYMRAREEDSLEHE
jgi:hypothetical protein